MRFLCETSSNDTNRNKFFAQHNIDALLSSFIKNCVVLSNEEKLIKQLSAIAQDGHQQLQIISDFDYTITKYIDGGQRMLTTHEAIEMHPNMKKRSIFELRKLRDTYLPIEMSCVKDPVVLRQHMDAWWNQSYSILLANPITRRMIVEVEQFAPIVFRQEFTDFAAYLRSVWIPLTVFSAGLGDVIAQLMQSAHMSMENVLIAANYMRFGRNVSISLLCCCYYCRCLFSAINVLTFRLNFFHVRKSYFQKILGGKCTIKDVESFSIVFRQLG
ncbi:hypothetical protein EG68_05856 [Paragonimus skrjabini miyazakii]|uniref:5'-nucleotidase n=1 Tax=Paragonimus skrjabini miyazakii TaxID=59628 RepID=A0A8S9Z1F2_9TREM|nr:hypothetical protein EG68_05856 [Paragonimus skrjabini miyazakii]